MYRNNVTKLAEQCRTCLHLRVFDPKMNGKLYYACGKFPLTDNNMVCPKYEKDDIHAREE